ncbi:MAG: carbon storage regulator CsrA [Sedimentisphaerales bacterium]|nr:carbon storage regulator CsrA [Sedimentisphaerales bacterium]
MLVLSRQKDQTIMIGDKIEITVVDIRGDKVRLGITAPTEVPVHRKEVYDAIKSENREAANVRLEDISDLPGGPDRNGNRQPPGASGAKPT